MNSKFNSCDLEPACFYLRKSREDQEAEARGEGDTLAKHRRDLFRLAKNYGVNITKVFEEVLSGEKLIHRPEMLQVLREVEEGKWRSVWCIEVDRLGRGNKQDQGVIQDTFKEANTLIVTPRKIYNLSDEADEDYFEFEGFMANKELKIITRRLQGGRIRSVKDGNYIGVRPPYGYQIKKEGRDRVLVPHPEQADVVKLIFELYANGDMGANKIANELNRMGKVTYSGKPWESSTVLNIIKNEVYIGRLQWKKKESKKSKDPEKRRDTKTRPREEWIDVEGKHEPLVSKEIFDKAQAILKGKYHVPYHIINGITNPLAGLIKCDICGASMVYRPYSHQKYPHLMCYNPKCPNKSARFEYVERDIINGLEAWIEEYQLQIDKHRPQSKKDNTISINKKILDNLNKELKTLGQQKERLHELLERRIYDEATYLDRSQKLSERIVETEKSIENTEAALKQESKREKARRDIIPKLKKVLSVYYKTKEPAARNQMLKSVMEFATYRKERDQKGDEFALVIHPRLPQ